MSQRILIFERNEAIRSRIRAQLESAGFEICGETRDEHEAFAKSKALAPDLIIMDLHGGMHLHGGFDLIPELHKCAPSMKVLIFTLHEGPEFSRLAQILGAQGYALKSEPLSLMTEVRKLLDTTSQQHP
jgi:DNA-binding NarL/FixJ family response regulator